MGKSRPAIQNGYHDTCEHSQCYRSIMMDMRWMVVALWEMEMLAVQC
jgi:hypothetical protein